MTNTFKFLLYTNYQYSDLWEMSICQIKKYFNNEIICFTDLETEIIKNNCKSVIYKNEHSYTERLSHGLESLPDDDVYIFLHEDMILYDNPDISKIEDMVNIVYNEKIDFIKLHRSDSGFPDERISEYLYKINKNSYYNFVIQPTICKNKFLKKLFKSAGSRSIWDFEAAAKYLFDYTGAYCYLDEKKRGMFHYDSKVFPHIATAISKGKWNYSEYSNELNILLSHYNINKSIRGNI